MFAKDPFPNTTPLCDSFLRNLVNAVESTTPFEQANAKGWLDKIYNRKCQICLSWFYKNYRNHPSPFVQSIAKKANDYEMALNP